MAEFTLKIRRYQPESGEAPYWQEYKVDLEGHRSVLEGILQAKGEQDGTIGIRCSCRAAICGSCGVRINGKPGLACHHHLDHAARTSKEGGTIVVEPMGNMPVIKDLIVDMDAVHWKKIQRVTPWLLPDGPPPEREYVVPHESMVDITQTMACIQCGACVSDCLAMEVDPLFVGPAALAKSYRFVGDPRDGQQYERLKDLSEDPHGIYDCTHCFNCIEACPKGVAPMSQIMRLRRIASADHKIEDRNNGYRHEHAFVQNIEKYGTLHEANLLPDSYGGKFHPRAVPELVSSLPVVLRGLLRRKVTPAKALYHHKLPDQKEVRRIFKEVAEREEKGRYELNLYIEGYEEDEAPAPVAVGATVAQTEDVASGAEDKEPATTAAPAAPAAPAEPEAPQAAEPAAESTPQPEAEPQADDDEDDTTSQPDSEPAPEPPAEPAPAGDPGGSEPAPTADAESDQETVPAEPEPEPPTEPDERPVGHVHGEGDEGVPQDGDQTADNEEDQG